MTAVAHEVSRRMTADYAKERARDMAREKAYELKERAVDTPWLGPLVGAGIGALVGRMFMSRAQGRRSSWYDGRGRWAQNERSHWDDDDRSYRYDREAYGAESAYAGDRADPGGSSLGDKASELGDKASQMKEGVVSGAKDMAREMKDRLNARTHEFGSRIPDREALRSSAEERPELWAFAAMAMGALFGFALPVSDRERRIIEPAKEKIREASSQAMDMAESRVGGRAESSARGSDESQSAGGIGESRLEQSPATPSSSPTPSISPPHEPLH